MYLQTIEDAITKVQLLINQLLKVRIVETKVLEQPSSGFLGIGRKPAVTFSLFFYCFGSIYTAKEVANAEEQSQLFSARTSGNKETEVQDIVYVGT